jgi:hypothetical protein
MRKGLPKKYAQMGFKRGWKAYKKLKTHKKNTKVVHMARRKGGFKRAYKRYASRSKSKGVSFGSVTKILIGAGLAAVYEVFVSPMIPLDGMIKNIVELAAGIFLAAMPGMPSYVKSFGVALAIINAYSLVYPVVAGYAGTSSESSGTW